MPMLSAEELNAYYQQLFAETGPCLIWTGSITPKGYGKVWRDGQWGYVHRLVWEAAHGPIPQGLLVKHHCDQPACYRLDHLVLGTYAGNAREGIQRGQSVYGQRVPSSKLTDAQVREILDSTESGAAVARRFGVSRSTVCHIRTGKAWRHVS